VTLAAIIGVVLLAVVAVFQAAWRSVRRGRLSVGRSEPGRPAKAAAVASGIAAVVIYPLTGLILLTSAVVVEADWLPIHGPTAMGVLAILLGIGAVMNLISRSPPERVWGPVAGGSRSAARSLP
jgi:hypothetical protein